MNKVFEKIIENLNEERACYFLTIANTRDKSLDVAYEKVNKALNKAIEIVKQEAERYNGGWISCSERLPEEAFGCLVTVMDCEPSTQTDFENILPYFVGYDGETWNNADGKEIPFEVIAWMPLPKPYKESD